MRTFSSVLRGLVFAATLSGAFILPAHAASTAPAVDRDTVVIGVEKEFYNLDGLVAVSGDSLRYGWQIYDTLYGFDQKGNLVPRLATSVSVSDDARVFTYKLRPNVQFHNGATLTSRDVKASLEHVLDPRSKSTRRPFFAPVVDAVETPDDLTVVFKLKQPDGAFANKVAGYLYIVPSDYLASLPNPDAFAQKPVSLGPYKFKSLAPGGSELVLERFDDYWGEKPRVKTLIFRAITEPASRVNAVLRGEVDLSVALPFSDYARLRKESGLDVIESRVASPVYVRVYTTDKNSPFSNVQVRQALSYALDTNAIIKSVLYGVGEPLGTMISNYYPYGADRSIKPYPYDPAKARALLAQAGYPKGFETTLNIQGDMPQGVAEALAAYWGQVGVKVKLNRLTYATFQRLNNTHTSGPLALSQFTNALYDPVHPVGGAFASNGSWSDYSNPKVDALLADVSRVSDTKQRGAVFQKIGRELHDDAAAFFISEFTYVYAKKKTLQWQPQQGGGFLNFRTIQWTPQAVAGN
ncbi:glutathione ABC transporter substrate-binding protein GsiB [Caballeronia cordobensis]|uniref:Glutathione ABC transporter substrate-binding protein GsiB n=1 Tax=Caballeronia cordobensis TaxID=1353886 RepID=A0A158G598_CABCO|nr:ABC transporter substrate-binding protein [Caballeronia cordobensis]SAL27318.1 glutathione ABC transporter substrate-binding protein GsiB [Caballeronia cordobensis]